MDHSIRERFGDEHIHLEGRLERLRDAAEGADEPNLVKEWACFERELGAHMDAEEEHLFPVLESTHAEAVAAARADHARIRERLDELGMQVELHTVRLDTVDSFLELLRRHKESEDSGLYRVAEERLDQPARRAATARD